MTDHDTDLIEQIKDEVKEPSLYCVRLLNDDFTPFDFVIAILQQIFNKSSSDAEILTRKVHKDGSAVVGIYTRDIAETKVQITQVNAIKHGHPLQATVEKA